ncbi:MAG: NAD-dependent epimerase/dehydratase family protein [Verrucomicrobia bacterium]|nr:NAD-dependent epimerase/dehydratase family protein [Verrucomicrobiota bacterium]
MLMTGAAGFLGTQFVHYFLALNDQRVVSAPCHVVAMDNYLRGVPEWLTILQERKDIEVIAADIVRLATYPRADFIIHAASVASPIFYRKYPIETMDANIWGLRQLLDHARSNPPESLLFFSSSEIYGDPDSQHIPTDENYRGYVSCTGPRACYDESKRFGETLCVAFWNIHHVPVKIARPFNNYGPGLRLNDRRVLPDFFRDVLNNRDVMILSDGRSTRTFCYVSDAIEGYLRLILSHENGESFNIGTDAPEVSMADLAYMVIRVCGKDVKVVRKVSKDAHYLTDNPQRRCPDIAKARQRLGFRPKVLLKQGLQQMRDYYLDHMDDG